MSEKNEQKSPIFLESSEVSKVIGIPPIYLNKFIERKKYGIEPSIRAGKGRGSRRLFSEEDVFGIALIWWLFESGLRSEAIQNVLNELFSDTVQKVLARVSFPPQKHLSASFVAGLLRAGDMRFLAVQREPRTGNKGNKRAKSQRVILVDLSDKDPSLLVEDLRTQSLLFIPIGSLFEQLSESMHELGLKAKKSTGS